MPPITQVLHSTLSDLEIRNASSTTSVSAFTSTSSSASTSASTTPHFDSNGKLPSFLFEDNVEQSAKSIDQTDFEDEGQETDDTVIHYISEEPVPQDTLKGSPYAARAKSHEGIMDFEFENDCENTTNILEGNTRANLSIDDVADGYVYTLKQSQLELKNELHSAFEEFKFDIITDHLSLPFESTYSRSLSGSYIDPTNANSVRHFDNINDRIEETVSIRISDTPYLVLLHSIRPQLMSFSIISFVRRRLSILKKRTTLSLMTLAISILNMANNSTEGLKVYSKMLIYRTQRLAFTLLQLEQFLSISATTKNLAKKSNSIINNNSDNSSKRTRMNLMSSSIHLLISVFVKRIGKMITYVSDIGSLWKYIAVYGLDGDFDETKIVRNIIENPESCSCTWQNESGRLIRALQYVRKLSLCIIMSMMELEDHEDKDKDKSVIFMRNFWAKFGFENVKWNVGSPTFATRLLGMCTCLDEFIVFVDSFKREIIEKDVHFSTGHEQNNPINDSNESKCSRSAHGLDVVSEKNEDDRIRELNSMVSKIGYKLDLIELGMDTRDSLFTLRNDIDELVRCYNEVTSGKALKRNDSLMTRNNELKKLRISEILLDEMSDGTDDKKKKKRRSSGIDLKLFSVVRSNADERAAESRNVEETEIDVQTSEIIQLDVPEKEAEFRETLEKLCLKQRPRAAARTKSEAAEMGNKICNTDNRAEDDAFNKFKQELKQLLKEERL